MRKQCNREQIECQGSKKVKTEILNGDQCIKSYGTLDNLASFFAPLDEERTCTTSKQLEKFKELRSMTLADLKNPHYQFNLGPQINETQFVSDDCQKVLSVRKSMTGILIAKVQWKSKNCSEVPTTVIAQKAPKQLIKYYKSKLMTTQIMNEVAEL